MKRYIMCLLSFMFLFFSTINLVSIIEFKSFYNQNNISISNGIIDIQYKVFKQTKQAFSGICDDILINVNLILTTAKKIFSTYFDSYNLFFQKYYFNYCSVLTVSILQNNNVINLYKNISVFMLFFFGFVFIFILKYLGLLFTFGKSTIYYKYKKAYGL